MSEIFYGTGRRRMATARVFLKAGVGKIEINKQTLNGYFGRPVARMVVNQPLKLLEVEDKMDLMITVKGGGNFGQAQAIRHGISRALLALDENNREILRKNGFLTRDSRRVERKKPGLHKARKAPQFSKR